MRATFTRSPTHSQPTSALQPGLSRNCTRNSSISRCNCTDPGSSPLQEHNIFHNKQGPRPRSLAYEPSAHRWHSNCLASHGHNNCSAVFSLSVTAEMLWCFSNNTSLATSFNCRITQNLTEPEVPTKESNTFRDTCNLPCRRPVLLIIFKPSICSQDIPDTFSWH